MRDFKHYNRLILGGQNNINCRLDDVVYLAKSVDIKEAVYNDKDNWHLFEIDEYGYLDDAENIIFKEHFKNIFIEAPVDASRDDICMMQEYTFEEKKPYIHADWEDFNHFTLLESEHGVKNELYDITGCRIIVGKCYIASRYIKGICPVINEQTFFMFLSNEGEKFYIKKTTPFLINKYDVKYELISEEEFMKHEDIN